MNLEGAFRDLCLEWPSGFFCPGAERDDGELQCSMLG